MKNDTSVLGVNTTKLNPVKKQQKDKNNSNLIFFNYQKKEYFASNSHKLFKIKN